MNKEFHYIYQYLEKEGFTIDQSEFELQIQTHPTYPSLLSIIDTLSFFNIENGAFQVDLAEIELLPNRFVTILQDESNSQYCVVEKKKEYYFYYKGKDKIKVSKKILESRWNGIVILVESPDAEDAEDEIEHKKNNSDLIKNVLKKIFKKVNELSTYESKVNKSTYNYQVFKNNLLGYNVFENNLLESFTIQLGNINASLKIILVINPFSNYCKESYFIMQEILQNYFDKVCFDIRFDFNNDDYSNKNSKKIHQHLVASYIDFGQDEFRKVLSNWFNNKDVNKLCDTQLSESSELKINEILNTQFNSNSKNNIIFTPTIIINKYIFPKQYNLSKLSHFISEMSKDADLQ